jgi:Carboxypeptidase regulatory-like domain
VSAQRMRCARGGVSAQRMRCARSHKVRFTPKWILILSLAALCALSLAGQKKKDKDDENTRTLQGLVTDADDNPAVGAVVQLKDLHTLQIRSFITKDDGAYHFSGLKTDTDYEVKAQMNGLSSRNRTLSTFDSRKAPNINLKLEKRSEPRSPESPAPKQAAPPAAPGNGK